MPLATEKGITTHKLPEKPMPAAVEQLAKQRILADCRYAYYLSKVRFNFSDGVLTLRGCVPTHALRHVLDSRLADIEGVTRVENWVHVISSSGLSSVHPK